MRNRGNPQAAAAPATVSAEVRPTSHWETGKAGGPRMREPGDLPEAVTIRMRGRFRGCALHGGDASRRRRESSSGKFVSGPLLVRTVRGIMSARHSLLTFASALALAAAVPAAAQDLDIGEIVVTPNKTPTARKKTGVTVETIDKAEIDKQAKPAVLDYLAQVPGVAVASPGGSGQEASLAVRGADKKYVKTLWNGIDIADPSNTQVQVGFQHLGALGVTGLEVLKGSQSTHYGSDAVAGVIAIDTLGGIATGVHHDIALEAGMRGTFRAAYGLSGADDLGKASLSVSGLTTNGFSAAATNGTDPALDSDPAAMEPDFYRNGTANFAFDRKISDNFTVFGAGLFIASEGAFDDGGTTPMDNELNEGRTRQFAGRAGFTVTGMDGRLRNTFAVQGFGIVRDLHLVSMFGPFDAVYSGRRAKAEYQGAFDANDKVTLQWGGDLSSLSSHVTDNYGTDTNDSVLVGGLWAQAIFTPVEGLTLDASLRHDIHSAYGGQTTWRGAASYAFSTGTRLHGSVGTGYRAPSLYELYAPFGTGNPALRPETSFSADLGVEQTWMDGRFVGDVTAFMLNTTDLIDYDFGTFSYQQVPGVTRRAGVEVSLKARATDWLDLTAAYTFTHTRAPDGLRRPRIPVHAIALGATATPAEKWEIAANARIALDTLDTVGGLLTPLDDYIVVDAKVAFKPKENLELYVRGENLFNARYQTIAGYNAPPLGVFAGLKARF